MTTPTWECFSEDVWSLDVGGCVVEAVLYPTPGDWRVATLPGSTSFSNVKLTATDADGAKREALEKVAAAYEATAATMRAVLAGMGGER